MLCARNLNLTFKSPCDSILQESGGKILLYAFLIAKIFRVWLHLGTIFTENSYQGLLRHKNLSPLQFTVSSMSDSFESKWRALEADGNEETQVI